MGAEYTHAQTVKDQVTLGTGFNLPPGMSTIVQAWRQNARAGYQVRFLVGVTNQAANPVTSVTVRGSNTPAGAQPYSDTVAIPIMAGDTAWFEFPGPCPEYWQLECTSLQGTTIAYLRSEVYIVQS